LLVQVSCDKVYLVIRDGQLPASPPIAQVGGPSGYRIYLAFTPLGQLSSR